MVKYIFREEFQAIKNAKKADPQKLGLALQKIQDENPGEKGYPQRVVEAARNARSPLHKHFTWDDAAAAEAYRREEARTIIRSICVEDDDGETKPAFLSVNSKSGVCYHSIDAVMASVELQEAVLRAAERDLSSFTRRYAEMRDICEIVQDARDRVRKRIEESRPSA